MIVFHYYTKRSAWIVANLGGFFSMPSSSWKRLQFLLFCPLKHSRLIRIGILASVQASSNKNCIKFTSNLENYNIIPFWADFIKQPNELSFYEMWFVASEKKISVKNRRSAKLNCLLIQLKISSSFVGLREKHST